MHADGMPEKGKGEVKLHLLFLIGTAVLKKAAPFFLYGRPDQQDGSFAV